MALPSRCRGITRWASGPVRTTRPRLRAAASPPRTTTLSAMSTSDRAQAVGTLNEIWNSLKISVVKVW